MIFYFSLQYDFLNGIGEDTVQHYNNNEEEEEIRLACEQAVVEIRAVGRLGLGSYSKTLHKSEEVDMQREQCRKGVKWLYEIETDDEEGMEADVILQHGAGKHIKQMVS